MMLIRNSHCRIGVSGSDGTGGCHIVVVAWLMGEGQG